MKKDLEIFEEIKLRVNNDKIAIMASVNMGHLKETIDQFSTKFQSHYSNRNLSKSFEALKLMEIRIQEVSIEMQNNMQHVARKLEVIGRSFEIPKFNIGTFRGSISSGGSSIKMNTDFEKKTIIYRIWLN